MTFLEISNQVAFLSGTFPSLTAISTVSGQSGRKAQVVNWVNVAWQRIQSVRSDWLWMRDDFLGDILTPTATYTPADFSITRFERWVFDAKRFDSGFSLYRASLGVSDEQPLQFMPWESFRRAYLRGPQTAARPGFFTVEPGTGSLILGPAPDYDYELSGEYQKSPQVLSASSDTPECPSAHHWAIVWYALCLLAENDEATTQYPAWQASYRAEMTKLERAQLPAIEEAEPLA